MSIQLTVVDCQILEVVARDGPLSTADLAEKVGENRGRVYRRCQQLAKAQELSESKGPSPRKLFFSTVTGEVVTRRNRDRIQKILDELDRVVWRHARKAKSLTDDQKAAIRRDVEAALRDLGLPPARRKIVRRRLSEALEACGGSHATGALASVPFSPIASYWAPAGNAEVPYPFPLPEGT